MNSQNIKKTVPYGVRPLMRLLFGSQHQMKMTGILFTQGCEILCWGLLFLSNDVYSRHRIVELFFGILYLYFFIRTVNLDVFICSMGAEDGFDWKRFTLRQRTTVCGTIISMNILFIFPMLFVLTFEQMFLTVVLLGLVLPAVYKEMYFFFIDLFLAKIPKVSLNTCIYVSLKFLHVYFILLCSMIIWIHWYEGFLHKFYSNNGVVQYQASGNDRNGIRKCVRTEYISNTAHGKFGPANVRSKKIDACSAILGEYVTFNCRVNSSDSNSIVFRWMKGTERIHANERYKISKFGQRDILSRKFIWNSNLTINRITSSVYNTYTCLAGTIICKKLTAKEGFMCLIYRQRMCYTQYRDKLLLKASVSIQMFTGSQHVVRAPLGYLLKLQKVFPLRFREKTLEITFINDGYNKSFRFPFKFCSDSIKRFHKLDKIQVDQFSETTFCTFLYYGRYFLRIKFDTGNEILHPNSVTILPATDISVYFHINSRFLFSRMYTNLVSNITTFDKDNPNAVLINTVEELVYNYMQVIESHEYTLMLVITTLLILVELKVYQFFLHRTRASMGLERKDRARVSKADYDIFLSFCEQSQTDQSFVVEKLLPHFEDNPRLKVRSCHLIQSGSHLFETYSEEIQNCRKVVILWSKDYADDSECRQILSAVILGLHSNELLKLSDIITLKYLSFQMPFRYSYLLQEYSLEVPDESENSLQDINDFLKISFEKDECVVDKVGKNIIFRLCLYIVEVLSRYYLSTKGKVKHLIHALFIVCFVYVYIWIASM